MDQVKQNRANIERGICLNLKLFEVVRNPPARMDSLPFRLVQMGEDQGDISKLLNIDLIAFPILVARCCCFEPQSTTGLAPMGLNLVLGPPLLRPLPGVVVEEGEGAGKKHIRSGNCISFSISKYSMTNNRRGGRWTCADGEEPTCADGTAKRQPCSDGEKAR